MIFIIMVKSVILQFNMNKYEKFKSKIIYIIQLKNEPNGILKAIDNNDTVIGTKSYKTDIMNAHQKRKLIKEIIYSKGL